LQLSLGHDSPMPPSSEAIGARRTEPLAWVLLAAGALGALTAASLAPSAARAATSQDWPPFVLVAGLLLVGLVAHEEGLFLAIGHRLALVAPGARSLFVGGCLAMAAVTAVLNLDTAVAFLTPVLIYAARHRGVSSIPLLYGSLLLANAGSLLLPGSNLTNLIVLGHLHLSGAQFLDRMWPSWLAAIAITSVVVGVVERNQLRGAGAPVPAAARQSLGVGALAVAVAAALVIALAAPALPVFAVGVVAAGIWAVRGRRGLAEIGRTVDIPVLLGLFGVAVALGTVGRVWSGPSAISGQVGLWGTAVVAAGASVVANNLPAASLLAARVPAHPLALLVGLNLGPNLCATGSLAWVLWRRSARSTGEQPSLLKASRLGLLAVPPALAAAVALLAVRGS
jgi:arsenical pump membrane protein